MYVYSTLTNDQRYNIYADGGGDVPVKTGSVLIRGGTGLADKKTLVTPTGAIPTQITDEEHEKLKSNSVFVEHEKNGFVVVMKSREDGEKVATAGMETRDASAQLMEADFKEGEAPTTGKANKK